MKTLFVVAILAVSSTAIAQQDERRGFYLGAAAGAGKAINACESRTIAGRSASCDSSGSNWSAFGGYQFNRNVALEAGYTTLGKVTFGGGETKTQVWEASLLAGVPTSQNFTIFGRFGYFDGTGETTGVGAGDRSTHGPILGITAQYELGRNFALRLDAVMYLITGDIAHDNSDWRVGRIGALWRFR